MRFFKKKPKQPKGQVCRLCGNLRPKSDMIMVANERLDPVGNVRYPQMWYCDGACAMYIMMGRVDVNWEFYVYPSDG